MNQPDIKHFKEKLIKLQEDFENLEKEAENIRSWYKYQNETTDSYSESFIVNFKYFDGFESVIEDLDSLIEYEEDQNCKCEDE